MHAATFLRKRHIVLETALLCRSRMLRLIVVHEIFHFVWARLGNRLRREFTALLIKERKCGARGELGESSGEKKRSMIARGAFPNSRHTRDYVCESFCDTAAWLYSGVKRDPAFTLAKRWKRLRRGWFEMTFSSCRNC